MKPCHIDSHKKQIQKTWRGIQGWVVDQAAAKLKDKT